MVLFPSSIFLFLLGKLFIQSPPKEINNYWGFRSKSSMKNKENWEKAQKEFGIQSEKLFKYTSLFSLTLLLMDIILIFYSSDNFLVLSLIIQSIVLILFLVLLYLNVNKELN
ncbi:MULTISPECIES: SdpI family protein [Staphylococcus]|uniref:SdpI family protein n=1 Tax=Staphylococcus TaxID=1279 RepID=UPI0011A2F6C3|nr:MULTISPECIES: SdpI family protein [Staphylococcus]HCX9014050.1 SdpI family protein [Staphylococcus aureus]MBO1199979.1 SdpI family protein [Staphylococcus simiae]MBO1202249.1 SdpI family protein [Staphylococcus simiae]MBO1212054.1 SdpI family protein [Staphylococcus simiae]MBO1230531.1 SdpI family protein [Staphylococcus simiae]